MITTVSHALSGYGDVNENTRQHIIAIAERLGYQPNLAARHLRSKQTKTIGMVIPLTAYFSDPFFMELLSGVGRQAAEYGYDLLLSAQQPGEEELNAYRRIVASSRIDGVVVARVQRDDPRITFLKEAHHPFVVFGRSNANDYPYIDVDGRAGVHQIVLHLARLGHRRIAFVLSPPQLAFTALRYEGYCQGLAEAGLPLDTAYIVQGDLTRASGHAAAARLLALPEPPTAIVACNDSMALGAMLAIQEQKLVVGRDVAVALRRYPRRSERQPAADHRPAADLRHRAAGSGHAHTCDPQRADREPARAVGSRIDCAGIERWNDLSRPVTRRRCDAKQVER